MKHLLITAVFPHGNLNTTTHRPPLLRSLCDEMGEASKYGENSAGRVSPHQITATFLMKEANDPLGAMLIVERFTEIVVALSPTPIGSVSMVMM